MVRGVMWRYTLHFTVTALKQKQMRERSNITAAIVQVLHQQLFKYRIRYCSRITLKTVQVLH